MEPHNTRVEASASADSGAILAGLSCHVQTWPVHKPAWNASSWSPQTGIVQAGHLVTLHATNDELPNLAGRQLQCRQGSCIVCCCRIHADVACLSCCCWASGCPWGQTGGQQLSRHTHGGHGLGHHRQGGQVQPPCLGCPEPRTRRVCSHSCWLPAPCWRSIHRQLSEASIPPTPGILLLSCRAVDCTASRHRLAASISASVFLEAETLATTDKGPRHSRPVQGVHCPELEEYAHTAAGMTACACGRSMHSQPVWRAPSASPLSCRPCWDSWH